ncbi:MAG: RNA polymerase sigma-54 factor [Chitinophagaceae bacterium]|jgi:RNA polymerase sigma-54 factor|nr:MAG: RNA polymerase sigma-54 factor [Chitinophagaceae bacterium]
MASIRQTQQQKMLQKLSPQQIQLVKLLQIPTASLEERVKEEMEENPALEFNDDNAEKDDLTDNPNDFGEQKESDNEEEQPQEEYDQVDISDYLSDGDDDIADYRTRDNNYSDQEETHTIPIRVENTFHDSLVSQLSMLRLNETQEKIAMQIIGSIDDDGYLRRDPQSIANDLAFSQNLTVPGKEIQEIIKKIQEFDPPGIGAADLQECLLIQLKRKSQQDVNIKHAEHILEKYFDEFTKKHYEKIQKSLNLSDKDLKLAIDEVIKLNPKPGGNFGSVNKAESYIVPDFFIYNNNGSLELTLNSRNAPDLHISDNYREMLRSYEKSEKKDKRQKEAVLFIKQKIDAAKWFIDAIKQRQHTLLSTMETIMRYQEEFFLTGDETTLRPMILKDIADRTGLDISTVSRVANSKYVQTEFGPYKLKYFFSESLSTESGEEVSTREVKKILQDIIDNENKRKPLSDENLTQMLQDKGYNIARRTVAKYREQLNIPVARLRKEL